MNWPEWGRNARPSPATSAQFAGPVRLGLVLFTAATAVAFVVRLWIVFAVETGSVVGVDHGIYQQAAQRWFGGGFFYYPEQLSGPYEIVQGHILYPPVALAWLVPAAYLPDLLWWGIPLVAIAVIVVYHRPPVWAWPLIGLCVATFWSVEIIASGNPGIWIAMFVAVGTVWRPAFALVLLKPSLFVFALPGIRSRGWWVIAAALAVISVMLLPMSLDYVEVVLNTRGANASLLYSIRDVPLMLVPLIAWVAGRHWGSRSPESSLRAPQLIDAGASELHATPAGPAAPSSTSAARPGPSAGGG